MKIFHGLRDPKLSKKKRCLAIGIFDGVHPAHVRILRKAIREARRTGASSMAVTFDPHPQKVLSGDHRNPPILMSLEHRLRAIAALGVDEAAVLRFDRRFADTSRDDFLVRDLIGRLGARLLSVGHDFRFGRRALGNTAYLRRQSSALGFKLYVCPVVRHLSRVISSTAIRRLIEKGDLRAAERLLGRPVSVYGSVIKGRGRGRRLGFPTANLDPHHETLPPDGVYAVRGMINGTGRTPHTRPLRGVLHIGSRPTFSERKKSVEVHLFDRHDDLYGHEIELFFVRKLRPIRRFSDASALTRAIRRDIQRARRLLGAR